MMDVTTDRRNNQENGQGKKVDEICHFWGALVTITE